MGTRNPPLLFMSRMQTGIRIGRHFTFIVLFMVASIILFNIVLSSSRVLDHMSTWKHNPGQNATRWHPIHSLSSRNLDWLSPYNLNEQQLLVENWILSPDPHNFTYIHNPKYKCYSLIGDSDILLVIFVNSAPRNQAKRAYIRRTFGNASAWPTHEGKLVMRIVFMLGVISDSKVQNEIHFESLIYDDIVQETFTDDYLNMTRKTIMGLKWVSLFCRAAKFTMKVDDDVLINAPLVYHILRNELTENFTLGTVLQRALPARSARGPNGKFYTPGRVYPAKYYPPYFNGHAYILSTDVAEKIYRVSMETDIFPWSDVFVGMCLHKLGIRLRHSQLFWSGGFRMANKTAFAEDGNAVDEMREFVSVFHFPVEAMDQIWSVWTRKLS